MQSTYELVIDDDAGIKTIVPLGQAEVSIGRKTGNAIKLTERNVSRHHARLVPTGDALGIEDLGSYTGVLVNGQRIAGRTAIAEGDRVQIGEYHLALRRVAVAQPRRDHVLVDDTKVLATVPAVQRPTLVVREVPAVQPSTSESRPQAAPAVPSGRAGKRLWGVSLGAGIITLLCGVVYLRQAATPAVQQTAAPKVRAVQALAPPQQGVHTAAPALPTPPPSPPAAVTTPPSGNARVHRREVHANPPTPLRPAADTTLSEAQAAELLTRAQAHYFKGNFAESIRLARMLKASPGVAMTRAFRIMGAAACKRGDFALINEAYRHVDVVSRQYLLYVCQQAGVTLSSGRFQRAQ